MKKYMENHETYLREQLAETREDRSEAKTGVNLSGLLKYHRQQIEFMQHERLIHLLVMALTILALLFSSALLYLLQSAAAALLWIILLILTIFYIRHYYFLENTLQSWYRLANTLEKEVTGIATNLAEFN